MLFSKFISCWTNFCFKKVKNSSLISWIFYRVFMFIHWWPLFLFSGFVGFFIYGFLIKNLIKQGFLWESSIFSSYKITLTLCLFWILSWASEWILFLLLKNKPFLTLITQSFIDNYIYKYFTPTYSIFYT